MFSNDLISTLNCFVLCAIHVWISNGPVIYAEVIQRELTFLSASLTFCSEHASLVTYTARRARSRTDCIHLCASRDGCAHVLFRAQTLDCYLQDSESTISNVADYDQFSCFQYSEVKNVALGAPCEVSSTHSVPFGCSNALNGVLLSPGWASYSQGVGMWIQIDFKTPRILTHGRVMQRRNTRERSKDILISFSDGSSQQFQLPLHPENSFFFDELTLPSPVKTRFVKIAVLSVYSKANNGFVEIEFYARVRRSG